MASPYSLGSRDPDPASEPPGPELRAPSGADRAQRRLEASRDQKLVAQALGGDEQAFTRLVARYQRRAHAIALAVVRDEHDAQEIVQEAFLRVHRNLKRFEGGSSFFTWLYRIVTNLSIDLMRRPARRQALVFGSAEGPHQGSALVALVGPPDPYQQLFQVELRERLARALSELPPYHRAVIELREGQGLSYQEIAEELGVSKGTVMSRLFHARRKLQLSLGDYRFHREEGSAQRTNEQGRSAA